MTEEPDDERGFIERIFANPGAVATILIAVIGQAIFSIVLQVSNNEQQESKIRANTVALAEFKSSVNNLQTPLSGHVIKLESELIDIRKAIDEINKRLDTVDNAGTRALSLVAANQNRETAQVDRLAERIIMQDRKVSELENKIVSPTIQLEALKEQQLRILQALDNTYNILQEHLRSVDGEIKNRPLKR